MVKDKIEVKVKVRDTTVAEITNQIFWEAVNRRASDVFVEPLEDELQIRFRIDGILHKFISLPAELHSKITTRLKVIGNLDIAEHRLPQDGSFKMKLPGREVDFRLSIMPCRLGEKSVLRLLDKKAMVLDIDYLGIEEGPLKLLKENLKKPYGMIIICGPTGSGKTTTLYAGLKYIDAIEKNIVSVEDPIEYQLYGINQVAVNEKYGLSFAAVLRSILRQDPNVILVGEIRDSQTAEIAIRSALTGHLVLSSLHATTATAAINRLINMGIEPFLIASSFLLVCSQSLVRLLCVQCKEPVPLPAVVLSQMQVADSKAKDHPSVIYKAKGCPECNQSGYFGRRAITEAFVISPKIKELISEGVSESMLRRQARIEGMSTLRESALALLSQGQTSFEEVLRLTSEEGTGE